MKYFATENVLYKLYRMKHAALVLLFVASSYAQTFEARTANLVSGTPPDLDAYQANIKGYEWTLRNGAGAISLAGRTPFMYWYREPFTSAIVTASVSVVSATGGVFRATFQPSDLNPSWFTNATSGSTNMRYAVGIEYSGGDEAVSHGRLRLIADPGAAGAVGVTFFTTNLNWALINWTGLPDWMLDADADGSLYARRDGSWEEINVPSTGDVARALAWSQAGSNLAATANGAAQVASNLAFSAAQASTDLTARAWAVAASNLAAAGSSAVSLAAISNLVVGTSNELSGRIVATSNRAEAAYVRAFASATGTPVYAESDPLFVAASNALLTKAQASALYATGTPVYAVSGLGTDAYARTTAEWASNRANAAHSIASAAATGSPIYSISGLATGTPVYTESDPVYVSASTGLLTKVQASALYATGTPLYVESNPSLVALSNGVAAASSTGTAAHLVAVIASNQAAQAVGWGNHATNGYLHLVSGFTNSYLLEDSLSDSLIFKPGNTLFTWRNEEWGNNVTGFPKSTLSNGDRIYVLTQSGGFIAVTLSGGNWDTSLDMSAYGWSTSLYPVVFFYRDSSNAATVTVNKVSDPAQSIVGYYDDLTIRYTLFDLKRDVLSLQQSSASYNLALGTNAPAAWTNQPSLSTVSNGLITIGAGTTNAQQTASNALAIANGADTDTVAQASIIIIGLQTTNANIVASNAQASVNGLGVVVSNLNPSLWSQVGTNTITQPSNSAVRVGLSLGLSGEAMIGQGSAIAPQAIELYGWTSSSGVQSGRYTMGWSGGQVYPAWATSSSTNLFYGPWNFSPSSYTIYSEFAAYKTNAIKLYAGAVTQNQVTARNEAWFSGTNLWIGLGGTNSMRFNGVLNAY